MRGRAAVAAALVLASAPVPPRAQAPQFRAGVDVLVVEATVLDRRENVVGGLGPADFTAEVGGKAREIVSAELVEYAPPSPDAPEGGDFEITTNEPIESGRIVLLMVDQSTLDTQSRPVFEAAKRWVQSLGPKDRVGLIAFPRGGTRVEFTTDHGKIADALSNLSGTAPPPKPFSFRNVSTWEAIRIEDGDTFTFNDVVARECKGGAPPLCPREIQMQANSVVFDAKSQAYPVLEALRSLVRGLGAVPGPKHALLLSAGWALIEREAAVEIGRVAAEAARRNVTVHTLCTPQWALSAANSKPTLKPIQDQNLLLGNVEMLSGMTGGRAVRITGSYDSAFTQLNGALSGYYRLGIRALPEDLDGKEHRITLKVTRSGAQIASYRRLLVAPAKATAADADADPEKALREALKGGPPQTAIGLRATTYVLHATGGTRDVRVVVAGDATRAAAGKATVVAALYQLDGKPVTARETTVTVPAAGPVPLSVSIDAAPGDYALRLAVRDAEGRLGSLERLVEAKWKKAGPIETPGLVLFHTKPGSGTPVPVFDGVDAADQIVAQLALAGPPPSKQAEVEILVTPIGKTAPLLRRAARVTQTTGGQTVVHETLPASLLPPGRYTLAARIGGTALARMFTVRAGGSPAPAPTTATAAAPGATAAMPAPFARPRFSTASVLDASFVGPAIDRLAARPDAAAVRDALQRVRTGAWAADSASGSLAASPVAAHFVAGLARLEQGELEDAARAFRATLQAAPDFGPALAYLGACYAAGGKDKEAAGAWQMALVRDKTSPALQRLAIEAWLRAGNAAAAQALAAQGRQRWPGDEQFAGLQAQAALAGGRAQEGLELVAAMKQPDAQTLLLALNTLYEAARGATPVWDTARDLETMRALRERYAATTPESLALVDAWIAEVARAR